MTSSDLKLRAVPLLADGLTDSEIAARLGIDSTTVATWRAYDADLVQLAHRLRQSNTNPPITLSSDAAPDAAPDAPPIVTTRMAAFS